ncbi:Protein LIPS-15 [Aphelenchoides avenae]|nr:Protein LIPS-15 [Aphelenchus avenae]
MEPLGAYFRENGYADDELYATTYGSNGAVDGYHEKMHCEYVKQVRNLIVAVANYTKSSVKVISYSMGGPISRKAILGGKCVDTGEDLGPPLTKTIRSYLTVAGANRGAMICWLPMMPLCNMVNGLHCQSSFMRDINAKSGYEGQNIYVLQSTADEVVGNMVCFQKASEIPGAKEVVTKSDLGHTDIIMKTASIQYDLINKD